MFDSPIAPCPFCGEMVLLDQTQRECAAEHRCERRDCPLADCFTGHDFTAPTRLPSSRKSSMSTDRRQFWRATFHSPAQLTVAGHTVEAALHDISLKGALLLVPVHFPARAGERCELSLTLGEQARIVMYGHIAHIEDRRLGMRCDHIDLDSITHLRRLVELNAGDPALLDRELSALLHSGGSD